MSNLDVNLTQGTCFHNMTSRDNDTVQKQIQKLKSMNLGLGVEIIEHVSSLTFGHELGKGSQGSVREGKWKGLDIAIKTMHNYTANDEKSILREITFLCKVRHPNIIQVRAICPQVIQYHVVTELCDGASLYKILKDPCLRQEYDLTNDIKNYICEQLCEGITYLHDTFDSPIIRRDIKALNVLLTKNYVVKTCDLGISKCDVIFTKNLQTLGTNNLKGTLPYMSPEITENKEATVYSYIWVLGCTIVELYQEAPLWKISSIYELVFKFAKKEKPDLQKLPIDSSLKNILTRCFEYVAQKRPTALELYSSFKNLNLNRKFKVTPFK